MLFPPDLRRIALLAACLAGWLVVGPPALAIPPAAPALLDEMDGPQPALRPDGAEPSVRILNQSIQHSTDSPVIAERVVLAVPAGASAPLAFSIPAAPVIQELRMTATVMCNRPGIRLAATVILPRSIDPRTGAARRLLVRGEAPAPAGDWQQLSIANFPALVAQHVRAARSAARTEIDDRGAFASQLVVLAPGGRGVTEVWVDQVAVYGVLNPVSTAAPPPPSAEIVRWSGLISKSSTPAPEAPVAGRPQIPAVPRIVERHGESLALLRELGFDAAWLPRLATSAELAEAHAAGLLLVCPPPSPESLEAQDIGPEYDMVLAWDLGEVADESELADVAAWKSILRRRETRLDRPLLLRSRRFPREAARIADILILGCSTGEAGLSPREYDAFLASQRRLVPPGTPAWIEVDADCGPRLRQQLATTRGTAVVDVAASAAALDETVAAAACSLPRGFWFRSHASLAEQSSTARKRQLTLKLATAKLELLEPWLATAKPTTTARSSRPEVTATVFTTERSHLLMLHRRGGAETSPADGASPPLTLVLPGTPETSAAYLVGVAGLEELATRRVTGGLQATVESGSTSPLILVTEDRVAVSRVAEHLRQHAAATVEAEVELALIDRRRAAAAIGALPGGLLESCAAHAVLRRVDDELAGVAAASQAIDAAAASHHAARASAELDQLLSNLRNAAVLGRPAAECPIPTDWTTLPDAAAIAAVESRWPQPPAPLAGGDFERLDGMLAAGWERLESPPASVGTAIRLTPIRPAAGRSCLELVAFAKGAAAPLPLAAPPAWVTSPPLVAPTACLVEFSGLVRTSDPAGAGTGEVVIFDSIGGEESALRISGASDWRPFRLLRAAPPGTACRLTIALADYGAAEIDEVRYRMIPILAPAGVIASRPGVEPPR